jgi:CRP-like cAMP-binding protein
MSQRISATTGNALLAALPSAEFAALREQLEPIALPLRFVLSAPGAPIDHVYFPESGMVSLVQMLGDGTQIEVGLIGREGFVGVAVLLGASSSPTEAMMQMAGAALRMPTRLFLEEIDRNPGLAARLRRYAHTLYNQISQTAACNGRHVLQERLAKWLLQARDRADSDEMLLNHEFLSMMLGTRRVGVTLALGNFKSAGIIANTHGRIRILDRASLEDAACGCYESTRQDSAG